MGEPPLLRKPAGLATGLPALHAALRGGRAPQQTTPCCSAARPRSLTPGCSCSAASGLAAAPWCWVRGTSREFRQSRDPGCPSPHPTFLLSARGREVRPHCRLWLGGSSCLPMPVLHPQEQESRKAVPGETCSGYGPMRSSKLQTLHRL